MTSIVHFKPIDDAESCWLLENYYQFFFCSFCISEEKKQLIEIVHIFFCDVNHAKEGEKQAKTKNIRRVHLMIYLKATLLLKLTGSVVVLREQTLMKRK